MSPYPKIILATIMREQGETGVQTYFNMVKNYLLKKQVKTSLMTPFSYSQWLVLPVFGVRKLIDKISGEFSVWWYRNWHYIFLKQVLIKQLSQPEHKECPVVIYAQCPLSAKAALEARQVNTQKVIMAVHFNISQADEWVDKGKIKRGGWVYNEIKLLESQVLPQLDGIVYVSRFIQEKLETNIPELANIKSICLPSFIVKPSPPESIKVAGDLINIGTLEFRKNQSYLLQVLAEAKKLGKCYSLTLIGDGPDLRKLETLAQSLGIAEQVKFMGFQKNAAQFLYSHRVYVHSALIEMLPIVIIEALVCNLPILAGAVGGIPEMFSDGVEGFYWPLDNPVAGAQKLMALIEDTQTYNKMAEAVQMRFSSNFDESVAGDRLLSFLCN